MPNQKVLPFNNGGGRGNSNFFKCYETHPPLVFTDKKTGKEMSVIGGNCFKESDTDIQVGFDSGMVLDSQFPWNKDKRIRFLFRIMDRQVPKDSKEAHNLIKWLAAQLRKGKTVHLGCIGGHGRTGTILAALVTYMTGEKDSITYVRKNYCKKAVESQVQVNWLHQEFGITKADPSDKWKTSAVPKGKSHAPQYGQPYSKWSGTGDLYDPIPTLGCIHKDNIEIK